MSTNNLKNPDKPKASPKYVDEGMDMEEAIHLLLYHYEKGKVTACEIHDMIYLWSCGCSFDLDGNGKVVMLDPDFDLP